MKNIFQNLFYDKEVANLDVDGEELTKKHSEFIDLSIHFSIY